MEQREGSMRGFVKEPPQALEVKEYVVDSLKDVSKEAKAKELAS